MIIFNFRILYFNMINVTKKKKIKITIDKHKYLCYNIDRK